MWTYSQELAPLHTTFKAITNEMKYAYFLRFSEYL